MRIVGGTLRGKALATPKGDTIRPTSDRTREALFNVLSHGKINLKWQGLIVADLFCGTGALGLEALSRGASWVTFVDCDPASLKLARRNAASCRMVSNIATLKLDAARLPPPARITKAPVDVVFLDAPYAKGLTAPALRGLTAKGWLGPGAWAVVEVAADETLEAPRDLTLVDERTYGAARILLFQKPE